MAAMSSARIRAGASRYRTRRHERALIYGDARGGPDGPRTPRWWLGLGAGLTVVAVTGAHLLALIRPPATLGDATIVVDRSAGALYVRIDDTWHPALNLASARLALGRPAVPQPVDAAALSSVKHGALLGIPGAPERIDPPLASTESQWTVCDSDRTVLIGGPVSVADPPPPMLVSGPSGTNYVLYDGRRAAVDADDPVLAHVLGLRAGVARPVSTALLGTIPEAPALTVPVILGAGNPGPSPLPGLLVGDIVRVERVGASGAETGYFVVLEGGVQPVGKLAAELIRFGGHGGGTNIPTVAPDVIAAVPTLGTLAVAHYPDSPVVPPSDSDFVCATTQSGSVRLFVGALPLPTDRPPERQLAQADGTGPALDAVSMPPGRSACLDFGAGSTVLVTAAGVRFAIADAEAAGSLGLPEIGTPAPRSVLAALPAGPVLSRPAALTVRDIVAEAAPRPHHAAEKQRDASGEPG